MRWQDTNTDIGKTRKGHLEKRPAPGNAIQETVFSVEFADMIGRRPRILNLVIP